MELADELLVIEMQLMKAMLARGQTASANNKVKVVAAAPAKAAPAKAAVKADISGNRTKDKIVRALRKKK